MDDKKETGTKAVSENRRIAGLLGFLLKAEVDAAFQQHPFKTSDGRAPLEIWRVLEGNRSTLEALTSVTPEPLPAALEPLASEIASRPTFKKHYEAIADYSFAQVPIDSLLTPQWFTDLDYVSELALSLGSVLSSETIMRFAFAEGRISPPVVTANQVQFISARRDLYADPIPVVKEATDGSFDIVIHAGSRPNYVQAAVIEGRLLLTNGVHRVCALHKAGATTCFCLVRPAGTLLEAGLNPQSTSLFRDALFKSSRPALVKDFLDPRTAAPLRLRSMYQILQVSIGVGALSVPALPSE